MNLVEIPAMGLVRSAGQMLPDLFSNAHCKVCPALATWRRNHVSRSSARRSATRSRPCMLEQVPLGKTLRCLPKEVARIRKRL